MRTLTLLSAASLFALGACAQIERPQTGVTGLAGFTACSEDTALSDLAAIDPGTDNAGLAVVCAPAGPASTGTCSGASPRRSSDSPTYQSSQ